MKYNFVHQHDEKDCGAACLSMIFNNFGLKMPLSKIRELIKVNNDGSNMYDIIRGAANVGLKGEALNGTFEELTEAIANKNFKYPFIAHIVNENMYTHFVVVYKITTKYIVVGDPAKGLVRYKAEIFSQMFTGNIITFECEENFKKADYTKGSIKKYAKLILKEKKLIFVVILCSLFSSGVSVFSSFIFQYIIDAFTAGESNYNFDSISSFSMIVIGLMVAQTVTQYVRNKIMVGITKKVDSSLIKTTFNHILKLPMNFFETRKTGEIMSRFSDISKIRDTILNVTMSLILDSSMVVFFSVVLIRINLLLTVLALAIIGVHMAIVLIFRKPIENINHIVMKESSDVTSCIKENIDGIETIKSYKCENHTQNRFNDKYDKLIGNISKSSIIFSVQSILTGFCGSVGMIILLLTGSYLCERNILTAGELMTFYFMFGYFATPLTNLVNLQPSIQTAMIAVERLDDIFETTAEMNSGDDAFNNSTITVSNLSFRYDNGSQIIKDLSLEIKKGEHVAIIGESGCGKTTFTKLLMGFYKPESGTIEIGGKSITEISVKSLRDRIAYISQDTFLFSDTIRNNLKIANLEVTDEEIERICKLTKADDFIKNLPLGYDTMLGEFGCNLSGGQKQRLAISRALLKKPDILIMDEATSNLDSITEESIHQLMSDICKDVTCIVIAHRLNTIKDCDNIVIMNSGRIIEQGTHEELIQNSIMYNKLFVV